MQKYVMHYKPDKNKKIAKRRFFYFVIPLAYPRQYIPAPTNAKPATILHDLNTNYQENSKHTTTGQGI